MEIQFSTYAVETILAIIEFTDSLNTPNAGERWYLKFQQFIATYFTDSSAYTYAKCNNLTFKNLELFCVEYNNWVIAFRYSDKEVFVDEIIHKSRIVD